ncbi:hypothetical protein [Herpetosiphon llansteffanensis]|uniref:hypothetical protein n=1 Tax=Herpetosiphon llansteffanensis TaxID=2094568 RepID=UPI000F51A567|nr:hypothetical protein [Herpetosiphon llansteffanensis]
MRIPPCRCCQTGTHRTTLDVITIFPALVRWVRAWWSATDRRIVLVLDATTLRQTVTVLTISIVYRSCTIPVAWHGVGATTPGAWRPHWEPLITILQQAIPPAWTVIVAADHGFYGRWLFQAIGGAGWHPLLRINARGFHRPNAHRWRRSWASMGSTGWDRQPVSRGCPLRVRSWPYGMPRMPTRGW